MDAPQSPTNGIRLTLELERGSEPARPRYRGALRSVGGETALVAALSIDGDQVTVEVASETGPLDAALAKVVVPLVRSAVRSAVVRGQTPPRRIQRWREP
jgi:hypothetical protein